MQVDAGQMSATVMSIDGLEEMATRPSDARQIALQRVLAGSSEAQTPNGNFGPIHAPLFAPRFYFPPHFSQDPFRQHRLMLINEFYHRPSFSLG